MKFSGGCAVAVLLLVAALLCQGALAATPQFFNYQAVLQQSNGTPITTQVTVRFSIYEVATGGIALWSQDIVATPDVGGRVDIAVGLNAVPALTDVIFNEPDRWLGVRILSEASEMLPRVRLASSPYSLRVSTVDGAAGGTVVGDLFVEDATSPQDHFFYLKRNWSGAGPAINFDNNDFMHYNRSLNELFTYIGSQVRFWVTPSGIKSTSLTFENGFDANFYLKYYDPVRPVIAFDADDYLMYERAKNKFNFKTNADTGQIVLQDEGFREKVKIWATGRDGTGSVLELLDNSGVARIELDATEEVDPDITLYDATHQPVIQIDAAYGGAGNPGRIVTPVLEITGGADFSEMFDVNPSSSGVAPIPGAVVCIDGDHPGKLMVSEAAYCRAVAGIVSGAGDVAPGLLMGHKGTEAHGKFPVALSGRVYVLADASAGAIGVGDLLTTAPTPGHAMRAGDDLPTHGAILGKAMTSLESGSGLVLVLVNLQ